VKGKKKRTQSLKTHAKRGEENLTLTASRASNPKFNPIEMGSKVGRKRRRSQAARKGGKQNDTGKLGKGGKLRVSYVLKQTEEEQGIRRKKGLVTNASKAN